ncbi:MAG: hypothetical protein ACRDY4_09815 [Acidimicrobiia bacterium]
MDERRAEDRKDEDREDEVTYAETKARQDRFEELVREEEREGDLDEKAFQDAVDRAHRGDEPDETPPSSTLP